MQTSFDEEIVSRMSLNTPINSNFKAFKLLIWQTTKKNNYWSPLFTDVALFLKLDIRILQKIVDINGYYSNDISSQS